MNAATLKVLIVDDEPLAIRRLRLGLEGIPDVEVVGAAANGPAALAMIHECRPDVALLDVKMPGLSGVELLERLEPGELPAIIFVTAFGRFAVDAFRFAAVDYLLKPVEFERLALAVERAREKIRQQDRREEIHQLKAVISELRADEMEDRQAQPYEQEIWIRDGSERIRVRVEDVDWFKAEGDYVRVHIGSRGYLVYDTIRSLEARLDPTAFVRVHRGAIVRRRVIARVVRQPAGTTHLVLSTGAEVTVARRYRHALRDLR